MTVAAGAARRVAPPAAFVSSNVSGTARTCADCGSELPAGSGTGRPRKLCDRCRDLHRIRTHLHLARVLAEDLDRESGLSSAIRIAIQVAVP